MQNISDKDVENIHLSHRWISQQDTQNVKSHVMDNKVPYATFAMYFLNNDGLSA